MKGSGFLNLPNRKTLLQTNKNTISTPSLYNKDLMKLTKDEGSALYSRPSNQSALNGF